MTPTIASIAITVALLAGDGLGNVDLIPSSGAEAVGIVPSLDVPAPLDWGVGDGVRRGGQATRIEFDDPRINAELSAWYRLAYVDGGSRLQVFEHSDAGVYGPESIIVESEEAAWAVANQAVGSYDSGTLIPALPAWALVRTGITDGPSAGLIFTLAYIDVLTSGALAGNLRVAGTGGIATNGYVFTVAGVEVKVATAVLAQPDVVFSPRPSKLVEYTTVIESDSSHATEIGNTVGSWLDVDEYEQAGRDAARRPGAVAFVVVHDFRQALAWLCGRTGITTSCDLVHRLAGVEL